MLNRNISKSLHDVPQKDVSTRALMARFGGVLCLLFAFLAFVLSLSVVFGLARGGIVLLATPLLLLLSSLFLGGLGLWFLGLRKREA